MDITIYDHDQDNNQIVKDICFRYTFRENIPCEIYMFEALDKMLRHLKDISVNELIIAGIHPVKRELSSNELMGHYLILMGESPTELLSAVSPGLRPSGLLLKPVEKERLEELLYELMLELEKQKDNEEIFSFHIKSQEFILPRNKILYFESRSKKIILRTEAQELEFYDTLDQLTERLGNDFIRVHKSFIVNMNHVSMIHSSNRTLHFRDGSFVPVSRTYKNGLMEEWNRRKQKQ